MLWMYCILISGKLLTKLLMVALWPRRSDVDLPVLQLDGFVAGPQCTQCLLIIDSLSCWRELTSGVPQNSLGLCCTVFLINNLDWSVDRILIKFTDDLKP